MSSLIVTLSISSMCVAVSLPCGIVYLQHFFLYILSCAFNKTTKQAVYVNITLRCVHATIVAVEKQ
jgi:hypothetical protein